MTWSHSILLVLVLTGCGPSVDQTTPCNGVVSTGSPEASLVGQTILNSGGNAADAAVAISFMLGVTEPAMSGIGGGCQILLSIPGGKPLSINGTTLSPALTDPTISRKELTAYTKSTVPSMVKTMAFLYNQYGSGNLSWQELIEPAIETARKGFTVGEFRAKVYQEYGQALLNGPPVMQQWMANGRLPVKGDRIKQPILAQTLSKLASEGPDAFYHGEIAEKIAHDMEMHGGWITLEDLNNFPDPQVRPALQTSYGTHTIYSAPPPAGGPTMLMALKLLEALSDSAGNPTEEDASKTLALALQRAHNYQKEHPWILEHYQREFDLNLEDYKGKQLTAILSAPHEPLEESGGETTHYSVVDGQNMAVAVTASINAYFGSRAASPELGFLYNSYMTDFIFEQPEHYYAIAAGKPAYSSMCPAIVRDNDKDVLILGSPGSKRIISTVTQVIHFWIERQIGIEQALAEFRIHALDSTVWLESGDKQLVMGLEQMGYTVKKPNDKLSIAGRNAYFGGVHALAFEGGQWRGAADPRRDGQALDCH